MPYTDHVYNVVLTMDDSAPAPSTDAIGDVLYRYLDIDSRDAITVEAISDDPSMADLIADPELSEQARETLRAHAQKVGEVDPLADAIEAARELGREAGRAAGSWAADGNTSADHARRILAMLDDGDPAAYDYLPDTPNLSGEWADSPTPNSIVRDVLPGVVFEVETFDRRAEVTDALSDAWEEGVRETFEDACTAELRAAAGLPLGTLRVLRVRFTIEDDGSGGSEQVYSETDERGAPVPYSDETHECDTIEDATRILRDAGATYWEGSWWAEPDGSHVIDYGTGECEEVSAHPSGFDAEQLDAITARLRD